METELDLLGLSQEVIDRSPFGIAVHDASPGYPLVRCNSAYASLFDPAARSDTLAGKRLAELMDAASIDIQAMFDDAGRNGAGSSFREFEARFGGELRHYTWSLTPISKDGAVRWMVVHANDVTELVRARQAVAASEATFRAVIEHSNDLVVVVDARGIVRYANPSASRILGYPPDQFVGAHYHSLLHPDDLDSVNKALGRLHRNDVFSAEWDARCRDANGQWRTLLASVVNRLNDPDIKGFIVQARDITGRVEIEAEILRQARTDSLTGLANRAGFLEHLQEALDTRTQGYALLLIDLDDFKAINDSAGPDAGDSLLCAVADRLGSVVPPRSRIARIGGDSYGVLAPIGADSTEPDRIAAGIQAVIREPFRFGAAELFLDASIGVTAIPAIVSDRGGSLLHMADLGQATHQRSGHGKPNEMFRQANLALSDAKRTGKARIAVYSIALDIAASNRHHLETDLHRALERGEFRLLYQPIVGLASGRVLGFEALLRWQHPVRGLLTPDHFLATVEDIGLLPAIGRWTIQEACRVAAAWPARSDGDRYFVSVNVSAEQIQDPTLVATVESALAQIGLPATALGLEILERSFLHVSPAVRLQLQRLTQLGIRLSLDDFGSEYSTLGYLRWLPICSLKIDRQFASGLGHDATAGAIVKAVNSLAQALGISVVMEGIETEAEATAARTLGVCCGQGYYFARPMSGDRVLSLLVAGPALPVAFPAEASEPLAAEPFAG